MHTFWTVVSEFLLSHCSHIWQMHKDHISQCLDRWQICIILILLQCIPQHTDVCILTTLAASVAKKHVIFVANMQKPHLTVFGSLDRRLADSLCSHCWHHWSRVVGPASIPSLSPLSRSSFKRRTAVATTLSLGITPDLRPLALRLVLPLCRA